MVELRVLVPQSLKRGNPVLVVSVSIPTCASKTGSAVTDRNREFPKLCVPTRLFSFSEFTTTQYSLSD